MVTAKYEQEVQKKKKDQESSGVSGFIFYKALALTWIHLSFWDLIVLNNSVKVQCLFIIISFIFFTPCLIFFMLTR